MVPISAHALFARPLVVAPDVGAGRRGASPAPRAPACCGATGAGPSTCRRAPGSRYAAARAPVRLVAAARGAVHRPAGGQVRPARSRAGAAPASAAAGGGRGPRCLRRSGSARSGVIESSTLELGPGLTVITGETGAGKTMVVTALGLLLGGRADSGAVRSGAAQRPGRGRRAGRRPARLRGRRRGGRRRGRGRPRACWPATSRPRAARGPSSAAPRSRSRGSPRWPSRWWPCTASPTSTGCCRPAGPARRARPLRRRRRSRALLARLPPPARRARSTTERELDRGRRQRPRAGPRGRPAAVRPRRDRGGRPAARRGRRAGRRGAPARLRRHAAHGRRGGPRGAVLRRAATPDALVAAAAAAHRSSTACATTTRGRGELADRLAELTYLLSDLAADVASYASGLETDPARLAAVSERRAALTALTRKYGETVDEVLAWAETSAARLTRARRHRRADRRGSASGATTLRAELGRGRRRRCPRPAPRPPPGCPTEVTGRARRCWRCRTPGSRSRCASRRRRRDGPGARAPAAGRRAAGCGSRPSGVDEVEFLLAANTGSEPRPLHKGASGGELSRVMLALEVALAGTSPVPTFVFDEVDAGVGGKAAVEVGRRLAQLARDRAGAGGDPPAAGRGVRRPPRRGREVQRRLGHHAPG